MAAARSTAMERRTGEEKDKSKDSDYIHAGGGGPRTVQCRNKPAPLIPLRGNRA